ncbi:unnamed protein product, partial [Allacma fusca]
PVRKFSRRYIEKLESASKESIFGGTRFETMNTVKLTLNVRNPNAMAEAMCQWQQENANIVIFSHNHGTSRSRFGQIPASSRCCCYKIGIIGIVMLVVEIVLLSGTKRIIPLKFDNIAARISAVENSKIDPCQDFSQFACTRIVPGTADANGTVMKSTMGETRRIMLNEIKSVLEEPRINGESRAVTMARQLFNECLMYNSSNYSTLKWLSFFTDDKSINEWPITEEQWNQSKISSERILALVFTHGGEGIFDIKVGLDKEDASRPLLIFRKGIENNLSDDDIFEHYEKLTRSVQALREEKRELSPFKDKREIFEFKNKLNKLIEASKCDSDKFEIWGGKKKFVKVNLDYIQSLIPQVNT